MSQVEKWTVSSQQVTWQLSSQLITSGVCYKTMPKKVKLDDGTEQEFYTKEELDQASAKAIELEATLKQAQADMATLKAQADNVNPNWAEARPKVAAYNAMKVQLEAKGYTIDEKGNVTIPEAQPTQPSMTPEEIQKMIDAKTDEKYFGRYRDSKLSKFSDEQRANIAAKYGKLAAGETITSEADVDKYLNDAINLVVPPTPSVDPRLMRFHGAPPSMPSSPPPIEGAPEGYVPGGFAESDAGKAVANTLFGSDSFAAPAK